MKEKVSYSIIYTDTIHCSILLIETTIMEFFLNGAQLSLNSANLGNLINCSSMNWAQFKDPVFHMCLAGTVATSWILTQEASGLSSFNDKYFLSLNSLNSLKTFRKNSNVWDINAYSSVAKTRFPLLVSNA